MVKHPTVAETVDLGMYMPRPRKAGHKNRAHFVARSEGSQSDVRFFAAARRCQPSVTKWTMGKDFGVTAGLPSEPIAHWYAPEVPQRMQAFPITSPPQCS